MSNNEPLYTLPDGKIVSFGKAFNSESQLVNALRVFNPDGTEATSDAVFYGEGTPVGAFGSQSAIRGVVAGDGGDFRVVASDGTSTDLYLFQIAPDGTVNATTVIDTSDSLTESPFTRANNKSLVPFSDGSSLVVGRTAGLRLDEDGFLDTFGLTEVERGRSTSDFDGILVGDRALAVTQHSFEINENSIVGHFFELDGTPIGDEFVISEGLDIVFGHADINAVELTDGRIAVGYTSSRDNDGDGDGFESSVFMTILNPDGTIAVPEQFVNTDDIGGAQDWLNLWPLINGGVAFSYGSATGFTPRDSINVRFFDGDGVQYNAFRQEGQRGREAEDIFVSPTGVISRFDVETPQLALFDATLPGEPGIFGDELLLSQAFLGELAEDAETATLADGRVAIVYDHTNLRGYVRILDPEARDVSDVEVLDKTNDGGVREMSVAALADGGFAVVWRQGSSPLTEVVQAKVYNADGTVRTDEFTVFDGENEYVQVHSTQSGFVVVWINDDDTFDDDGTAQFFDADGAPLGAAFEFHDGLKQETAVDAALLTNGNLVMTWMSDTETTSGDTAHFQIFNPDGTTASGIETISDDVDAFQDVRVVALDSGGFATLHTNDDGQLQLTVYTVAGALVSGPNLVDITALLSPTSPGNITQAFDQVYDIETTLDDQLAIAFVVRDGTDGLNVGFALVDLDGTVTTSGIASENVADDQSQVELARLADGQVLLSFTDDTNVQFAQQSSINGAIIQGGEEIALPVNLTGDAAANALTGDNGDDTLSGGGGDDTLNGEGGDDLLRGNSGEDSLSGGDGDDLLRGQKNGDFLDGGDGDDNIKGGGGNDTLLGGEGRDFLNGGTRSDSLDGGAGNDVLIGRSFADTLIGGEGNDRLNAGGGADRLDGGAGNDFLKGGSEADVFVFDIGFDADRLADFDLSEDRLEISSALAAGRDAEDLAALAQEDGSDVVMDFGDGDVLRLQGLGDVTGLGDQIDIV